MAVTATRVTTIVYTGDVAGTETLSAASNAVSPAMVEVRTLASGLNTITLPTGGATVSSVTIVPPAANTTSLTIKGVTGDTGIRIHNTDPTTISFHTVPATDFAITTGGVITGCRLYWT